MSNIDHDKEFEDAFKGFGDDPSPVTPPEDPGKPDDPATPPAVDEPPKKNEQPTAPEAPKDDSKKEDPVTPPKDSEEKPVEDAEPPKTPEAQTDPEEVKPLTKDDLTSIINNIRTDERTSAKELETTTEEVIKAYYPDGLSNVLVDKATGKELRTPQDVVEVTGGEMSIEEAQQWLLNEQYKLDTQLKGINEDARKVAETTINFKRDSVAVIQKYEPLFKWKPHLQTKVFNLLMSQVKADSERGIILSAPDVVDLYDTYLEPYQQAYEFSKKEPATNPTPPPNDPPQPSAEDRMDITGDGGSSSDVDDPNDFAQQVKKELAKG